MNTSVQSKPGQSANLWKSGAGYGYDMTGTDESATLTTNAATLTFNSGNEVLYMPFGSDGTATDDRSGSAIAWYDVTATKDSAGNTTVKFASTTPDNIDKKFRTDSNFDGSADHLVMNYDGTLTEEIIPCSSSVRNVVSNGLAHNMDTTIDKSISDMQYYGAGTATEATGTVLFETTKDLYDNKDAHENATIRGTREFRFEAGYGLTKDNN